jgi:hypothetical protein
MFYLFLICFIHSAPLLHWLLPKWHS